MQRYAASLLFLLLLIQPVAAFDMAARPPADGQPLAPGQLYLVHYRCAKPVVSGREYDLDGYLSRLTSLYRQDRNPFSRVSAVAHGVIISKKNVGMSADGKLDLSLNADNFPEAAGGFPIHVYSVVNGSNSSTKLDNRLCDGFFVVSGSDQFEVRPLFRFALNGTDNILAKTASLVLTSISPAISLVSGKPLAAKAADQIRAAGDLVNNYKSYMEMFREDGSESETIPLRVGVTKVGTFASRLEITVRPISSLLTDCEANQGAGCVNYPGVLADLTRGKGIIDAAASDLADQCIRYERDVRRSGISNDVDIAYALYQVAADSFTDKAKIIECLRPKYAKNAADNARFYRNVTEEQKITTADVEAFERSKQKAEDAARLAKSQPAVDRALVKTVDQFVRRAGRYACNNRLTGRDEALLAEMVRSPLSLADDTETLAIVGQDADEDEISGSFTEVMDQLRAKGFERYGCYSITHQHDKLQRWYDGAEMMMLMFRETCGGGPAKGADALGIRIFFDERKIAKLVVTDKWVDEMLEINTSCALPRPVAAPAPAMASAATDDAPQITGSIPKSAPAKTRSAPAKMKAANDNAKAIPAAAASERSVAEEIDAGDRASGRSASKAIGVPETTGSITALVPANPMAVIDAIVDAASGM